MTNAKASNVTSLGGPLGIGRATQWWATETEVDMSLPPPEPRPVKLMTEPQAVTIDLNRTAIVIIDMQNDFCTAGGWVDHIGGNYAADRAPIEPLRRLLPKLRQVGVPVV